MADQRAVIVRLQSTLALVQMLNFKFCPAAVADIRKDPTSARGLVGPAVDSVLCFKLVKKNKHNQREQNSS